MYAMVCVQIKMYTANDLVRFVDLGGWQRIFSHYYFLRTFITGLEPGKSSLLLLCSTGIVLVFQNLPLDKLGK